MKVGDFYKIGRKGIIYTGSLEKDVKQGEPLIVVHDNKQYSAFLWQIEQFSLGYITPDKAYKGQSVGLFFSYHVKLPESRDVMIYARD